MKYNTIFSLLFISLFSLSPALTEALVPIPKLPDTSSTSSFTLTINPGVLSVDIVDGTTYASVDSPAVPFGAVTVSFTCQTATGTLGTISQTIYVRNPDASDTGWNVSLAAATPAAFWDSAVGLDMDYNDPTVACGDGADTDILKGQMTVNTVAGTVAVGACAVCNTTGVVPTAAPSAFSETAPIITSIKLLDAGPTSSDIGDWKLTGVGISQTVPVEQPATNYIIPLTLTVTAQ